MKEKSFTIKNHIGIFDNYFSDQLCDNYIQYFDKLKMIDRNTLEFVQDQHQSLVTSLYGNDLDISSLGIVDFHKVFWNDCYPQYVEAYPIIKQFQKHAIFDLKIQKTEKGQGYHTWHTEMMSAATRNRFVVFSLFLNDVEEGGETEFLHQSVRIKAIKNRFILFPATYTHVHRGNPPLSGTKYIITGWVEFGSHD